MSFRFPSSISLSSALDEAFHSLILLPKDLETYDFNTTLASQPMKKLVPARDSAISVLIGVLAPLNCVLSTIT